MRYEDDFWSDSPGENRAPWELTPAQARRERRSCRKVEEFGERCTVLEENKAAQAQANARRTAAQTARQASIAEQKRQAQARLEAIRQAKHEKRQRQIQVGGDQKDTWAEERRFAENGAGTVGESSAAGTARPPQSPAPEAPAAPAGKRRRKGSVMHKVILCLLVGLLVGTAWSVVNTVRSLRDSAIAANGGDDDFYHYYDGGLSDSEPEEEYELEHYAGDSTGLSIQLVSSSGKRALTYQELYEKCAPSMVSISVTAGSTGSTGSGIIMTEDGYILTCNHVIDNGERCTVLTADNQRYQATLVGKDPQTDLAVLKISASGLTPAEFGDSDELVVGDEACAIGDPLGENFRATLTNGIISGVNRRVSSNGYAMTLIQTTAAVNSGNSGGALFNIYGQVVGVVNLKMVTSGNSEATVEGMGMAVPSSTAQSIVATLAVEGTVHRPVLGITCSSIDEDTAQRAGLPSGLLVQSVNEHSDCYAQGLQVYDIITEADGVAICTVEEFKEVISDRDIGDTVTLIVYRDNNLAASGDGMDSAAAPDGYDYQYYASIEVELMDSVDMNS